MFQRRPVEPDRPTLDTDFLARLESHIGADAVSELVADGLIELSDRLDRLAEHERTRDLDAIARLGHDLVGMAGNLGLARLSFASGEMNRAARDGGVPATLAEVSAVRRLGDEATEAMRRHNATLAQR